MSLGMDFCVSLVCGNTFSISFLFRRSICALSVFHPSAAAVVVVVAPPPSSSSSKREILISACLVQNEIAGSALIYPSTVGETTWFRSFDSFTVRRPLIADKRSDPMHKYTCMRARAPARANRKKHTTRTTFTHTHTHTPSHQRAQRDNCIDFVCVENNFLGA